MYLAVLTVSSALVAPTPIDSLRLVAWLAISMVGALVAFILVWPDPDAAVLPLAVGGALKGAVGIAVAIFFLVGGPTADIGIQEPDGILPRVHAFTWEANLYASFLAMCVPLALESARGPHRTRGLLLLALVVVGLPLGITRGAYLGLVAGIVAYAIVLVVASGRRVDLRRLASATLFLLLVGVIASSALLPNLIQRASGLGGIGALSSPTQSPGGGPAGSGPPGAGPTGIPAASPTPLPSLRLYPDTIGFRLERVPVALSDLRDSPIIGLGAESFGQRHSDPSQAGAPDHIAILAVAALYEIRGRGSVRTLRRVRDAATPALAPGAHRRTT